MLNLFSSMMNSGVKFVCVSLVVYYIRIYSLVICNDNIAIKTLIEALINILYDTKTKSIMVLNPWVMFIHMY